MTIKKITYIAFLALSASAASASAQQPTKPVTHGMQLTSIDRSVRPGDDFFLFANGGWLNSLEIPADRSSVGVFGQLSDIASKRTAALIEEIAKSSAAPGTQNRKIADLYNSYMNEAAIEARGIAPLQPQLDAINAIADKHELARALGRATHSDVDPLNAGNFHTNNLFGFWIAPGFDDPAHYHAYMMQGGIQLGDREFYTSDAQRSRDLLAKYQQHIAAMLQLAGYDNGAERAARVVALETAIARTHRALDTSQDVNRANNPWTLADFNAKAPGLEWETYLAAAGLSGAKSIIVWQPEAFTGEAALVGSTGLDAWKDLLAFHLIEDYAGVLPKAFVDERFAFFGTALSGASQQRPRWQRAVAVVNGLLGEAVGKMYAQRYFSPEAKATAQAMVTNIINAFRKRIDALDWMAPSTKAEAKAKLDNLYVGIGYPETWRDYTRYEVRDNDLFGNIQRAKVFEDEYQRGRLGAVVDQHEWPMMTPQTVNAVNLPLSIALNFPAAILEPPFFDAKAPAAANYGAIGTVIGHEISHTFDTEGSKIDSKGRLRNWWTPGDLAHFQTASVALAKQYDTYQAFPDLSVKGQQTLAENVADLAGMTAAFDAYHTSLHGKPAPVQGGFTGDQQFFIAFAQNWASKTRPAALRQTIMTNIHAPGQYRALEVRNVDAWYKSFGVKPTDKLYLAPALRVRIW